MAAAGPSFSGCAVHQFDLGEHFRQVGQSAAAAEHFRRALVVDPQATPARIALAGHRRACLQRGEALSLWAAHDLLSLAFAPVPE